MKHITAILSMALALFMVSCNQPKATEEKTTTTDTVKTVVAAPKPAFTPYKAMTIQHTVKDFDKWLTAFNIDDSVRKANGFTEWGVGRGTDNDKLAIVFATTTDLKKSRDLANAPGLKETMKKAGVTGAPTLAFVDVLRDDTSHIPQHERLMIVHHVKDFDTWLKAYDAEGPAARAANGMADRFLARGIDDPNTVTLLFAITDVAKLKARIASPEMKKLMTDAGVDGAPQITYFKWIN